MSAKAFLFALGAAWLWLPLSGIGQQLPDTSDLNLDALQIPNSPAFALMDLAPSVVDEPKVPADFVVFVRNATDSFSVVPRSYGIEFAPGWVFGRDKIDFRKSISNRFSDNLWQSLTVSVGINHLDDPNLPKGNGGIAQLGFGLKMSLLRGHLDGQYEAVESMYQSLAALNQILKQSAEDLLGNDPEYRVLSDSLKLLQNLPENVVKKQKIAEVAARMVKMKQRLSEVLAQQQQKAADSLPIQAAAIATLKARTAGLKLNRIGFKLDLAGGLATNFYDQNIHNSQVARAGAWLTGGWVFKPTLNQTNISLLGLLRLMGNPGQLYRPAEGGPLTEDDNLFFDYGGRFVLHKGGRFSCSAELLGRMPINNDSLKSTSRYALNVDYQLNKTLLLSFQFGKNFDGTVNQNGNLITAIQVFSTFGRRVFGKNGMK